ncbi:Wzz/FepE/Etk N-terminal domain-containing protein [Pseudazoarcus pumilus]|uniref:Polysaccharide chain length determinant N-terminal domain-containing protein n=1 Tax=Pseudazoarcus pumilus TaxID=2067960 RepID=A0A2I6S8X3_9RHOO|nr:Wzz/FepE/Etk N-terminal domain-containing protein [Pseudazoarcus pumilus]AUN95710.1 hypothetical protein C0099_12675 [Pseudazoarcus pumilus]
MTNTASPPPQREPNLQPDEIDLREVILSLWARRWLIAILTVMGALIGLALSLHSTRHVAQTVLLAPGMDVTTYRRYEIALQDRGNFEGFLDRQQQSSDAIGRLRDLAPQSLGAWIRPRFSLTEQEARAMGIRPDGNRDMLGFNLRIESRDAGAAQLIPVLSEYVRDTVTRVDIASSASASCTQARSALGELAAAQLEVQSQREQLAARADRLRALLAQADTLRPSVTSAFVPTPEETVMSRLIETEIDIADSELDIAAQTRQTQLEDLRASYYCTLQTLSAQAPSATALIEQAGDLIDQTKSNDSVEQDPLLKQLYGTLAAEYDLWRIAHQRTTNIGSPSEAEDSKSRRPTLSVAAGVGAFGGMFIGFFLTLVLGWWGRTAS